MVTEKDQGLIRDTRNTSLTGNPIASSQVDAEKVFFILLKKWPIILFCCLLGYFISEIYLRYSIPQYSASTSILLKDTRTSSGMSEATVFQDLGILSPGRNIDNEIHILKTIYLLEEVVKKLRLQYTYKSLGRLKSNDLYLSTPVSVLSWTPKDSIKNKKFEFTVNLKGLTAYTLEYGNEVYKGQLGESLKLPLGNLTLGSQEGRLDNLVDAKTISITIKPLNAAAREYANKISVTTDTKTRSTVVQIKCVDVNLQRATDVLTELINVYNETEISDKNKVYENTVNFIDERMNSLGSELSEVEGDVARFKSQEVALNLEGEAALLISETNEGVKSIAALEAQIDIMSAIREQLLKEASKFEFVPVGESITSPSLNGLLQAFNNLILERDRLKGRLGLNHPDIITLEKQIDNLRRNIVTEINTSIQELNIKLNSVVGQQRSVSARKRVIPGAEKRLLEIQRQQAIKQQLYLYLLQKREEAALSLSVMVANNRIIEPPKADGQISPNIRQTRLFALSLGLLTPIVILLISFGLNKKVMIEDHIVAHTTAPILGTIPQSIVHHGSFVINEGKRSAPAEMFRLTRANLQFIGEGIHNKVIAFTSSMSGEGKSFITLNMGLTLALGSKKVVLIELDMRKPKLAFYLNHKKGVGKGITDYLIDNKVNWKELINVSSVNNDLHYVTCGPLPPNPSELLLSERLDQLISTLRNEYDFVLIDTPPIGIVSDALLLSKFLDLTIYVVRQAVTEQRQLKIIEDIKQNFKMPRVYIIFNGVKFGVGGYGYWGGYGYGYGYNYGYGYGYYSDELKQIPWWKRIFHMK